MKKICFECHGYGKVQCETCHGTGIHTFLNTFNYPEGRVCKEECNQCFGRGEVICTECNGKGKIDDGIDY